MLKVKPTNKIVTSVVTFTNARIWEPEMILPGKEPLYTASILIPKTDEKVINGINIAVSGAIKLGSLKNTGKFAVEAKKNIPIYDGDDEKFDEMFRGYLIVNAASKIPPQIFDVNVFPITDSSLVQPGFKARFSMSFVAYKKSKEDIGVACVLGNIQKAYSQTDEQVLPDANYDDFSKDFLRIFNLDETP